MFFFVALFAALFTITNAKQDCYSCTSAPDRYVMDSWNWRYPNETWRTSDMKYNADNCDIHPWAVGKTISCNTLCLKWQFIYTQNGDKKYHTVRGCSGDLLNNPPSNEYCPSYQNTNGGPYAPGGGYPGEYRLCFCTGDRCNPATRMTAFGAGALMFIAVFIRFFRSS